MKKFYFSYLFLFSGVIMKKIYNSFILAIVLILFVSISSVSAASDSNILSASDDDWDDDLLEADDEDDWEDNEDDYDFWDDDEEDYDDDWEDDEGDGEYGEFDGNGSYSSAGISSNGAKSMANPNGFNSTAPGIDFDIKAGNPILLLVVSLLFLILIPLRNR